MKGRDEPVRLVSKWGLAVALIVLAQQATLAEPSVFRDWVRQWMQRQDEGTCNGIREPAKGIVDALLALGPGDAEAVTELLDHGYAAKGCHGDWISIPWPQTYAVCMLALMDETRASAALRLIANQTSRRGYDHASLAKIFLKAVEVERKLHALREAPLSRKRRRSRIAELAGQANDWSLRHRHNTYAPWGGTAMLPLRILGVDGVRWAAGHIRETMKSESSRNLGPAVAILAEFGDESHVPLLERLLRHGPPGSHLSAVLVDALLRWGSPEGVAYCIEAIEKLGEAAHAEIDVLNHVIGESALSRQIGNSEGTIEGHADWLEWWEHNRDKDIDSWRRGMPLHVH